MEHNSYPSVPPSIASWSTEDKLLVHLYYKPHTPSYILLVIVAIQYCIFLGILIEEKFQNDII